MIITAQHEIWFVQDLSKPIEVKAIKGVVFSQDVMADVIGVEVYEDGQPASLSGTLSANVIRQDGGTVIVGTGTIDGNKCSIVLPEAAYAYPGQIVVALKLTTGNVIRTLLAITGTVYRTSSDVVIDPGTVMPSIQTLIAQIQAAVASIPADYSALCADVQVLEPTANVTDIGKALIVKTVSNGKATSYEFGDAGGGTDDVSIKNSTKTGVDLDVSDNAGNVVLRLQNGHIKTKNFDSEQTPTGDYKLKNIFDQCFLYHHLNQEANSPYIPAQSLYDVRYAKKLGFDMIEVNTQKCSDNVFVCKHGTGGKLGAGIKDAVGSNDYSDTKFSDVTSTWIRQNVVYNAQKTKYCGSIPTLDEFCAECRKFGLRIKVSSIEAALVARKYLPDDMIWATDISRGQFVGTIEYVWYSNQSIDDCINACKAIGTPLNIVVAAGTFQTKSDADMKEMVLKAHNNGFTVGIVYPKSPDIIRAAKLGVDCVCSTETAVNLFENGSAKHIVSLYDSSLTLSSGSTYDSTNDVITMSSGATVSCAANVACGKGSLVIRYNGTLTITVGQSSTYTELQSYSSDGTDYVFLANVMQWKSGNWDKWFNITAMGNTTIYELTFDGEIIG